MLESKHAISTLALIQMDLYYDPTCPLSCQPIWCVGCRTFCYNIGSYGCRNSGTESLRVSVSDFLQYSLWLNKTVSGSRRNLSCCDNTLFFCLCGDTFSCVLVWYSWPFPSHILSSCMGVTTLRFLFSLQHHVVDKLTKSFHWKWSATLRTCIREVSWLGS